MALSTIEDVHQVLSHKVGQEADGAAIGYKIEKTNACVKETFCIDVQGVPVKVTLKVEAIR